MREFLKKLGVALLIALPLLVVLENYCTKIIRKSTCIKVNWAISNPQQRFDYAVLGSSRGEFVNVPLIDSITGLNGINLSVDGSGFSSNYLLLYLFLEKHHINTLLLQTDQFSRAPKQHLLYPFLAYSYVAYMENPEVRKVIYDNVPALKYFLWRYVPFMKYAEFNNKYRIQDMLKGNIPCTQAFDINKGSDVTRVRKSGSYKNGHLVDLRYGKNAKTQKDVEDALSVLYLKKIISLCREKQIRLVWFNSPYFEQLKNLEHDNYTAASLFYKKLSSSNSIRYVDFYNWPYSNTDSFFGDFNHVSAIGSRQYAFDIVDSVKHELQNK